ncbi:MAG TPA: endolytic transglycosylase MltG [Solirubrobacterales bacterium]|nr:endolytic transglycosylase MltG [Solirubrobacterales bacterium]
MTDEWSDPFSDAADPAAAERERRRLEREERRRRREAGEEAPEPKRRWGRKAKREGGAEGAPEEDVRGEDAAVPAPEPPEPRKPEPPPPERQHAPPGPPPPTEPVSAPEPPPPPRSADEEFWDEPAYAYEEGEESFEAPGRRKASPPAKGGGGGWRGALAAVGRHPFRVVGVLVALVVVWFGFALFQPFHGDGSGRVVVTVPKGASVGEVGDLLEEKGVVSNSTLFQIRVTLAGKRSSLYAGRFELARDMSYGAAIDALSVAPAKTTATVTIPEGYSRAQAAPLVAEDGLSGSYMKETVHSKYLNPAKYGGKGAKDLEGFLFPDTFELKPGAPAADLVQLQLEDFKRRIKGVDMSYAKSKNLTVYDVLTIASMVEREAGVPNQRKLVAAVIYNRLHEGMTLGIDATIRFATGNYTRPLTESELAVDSPYNTRTNAGLPPGPINSPGLSAIEAAAHPAKAPYLFYVNKPETCGVLSFSKTEAEFEADVAKYNAAREANGGNEPTTCGE